MKYFFNIAALVACTSMIAGNLPVTEAKHTDPIIASILKVQKQRFAPKRTQEEIKKEQKKQEWRALISMAKSR